MNEDEMMPAEEASAGGYTIEIHVGGDGQMTVAVETEQAEGAEAEGGEQEPQSMPVKGIKGAIEAVMQIYQQNGQMADQAGDAEFDSGFGGEKAKLAKQFP